MKVRGLRLLKWNKQMPNIWSRCSLSIKEQRAIEIIWGECRRFTILLQMDEWRKISYWGVRHWMPPPLPQNRVHPVGWLGTWSISGQAPSHQGQCHCHSRCHQPKQTNSRWVPVNAWPRACPDQRRRGLRRLTVILWCTESSNAGPAYSQREQATREDQKITSLEELEEQERKKRRNVLKLKISKGSASNSLPSFVNVTFTTG